MGITLMSANIARIKLRRSRQNRIAASGEIQNQRMRQIHDQARPPAKRQRIHILRGVGSRLPRGTLCCEHRVGNSPLLGRVRMVLLEDTMSIKTITYLVLAAALTLTTLMSCSSTPVDKRRQDTLECTKELIGYDASPTDAYDICHNLYSPTIPPRKSHGQ